MAHHGGEGRVSRIFPHVVIGVYGLMRNGAVRSWLRRLVLRLEGGPMYSLTVREIYRRFHRIDVGLYTIGPCEAGPDNIAPGTSIGRYCSIYYTVRILPDDATGTWDTSVGKGDLPASGSRRDQGSADPRLVIGNDVFIGHNAIILPSVGRIGDGAYIGAGAVVQKPVPPYAVVMGNPARAVKYRFSQDTIAALLASRWWLKDPNQLKDERSSFVEPLETQPGSCRERPL